LFILSQFLTVAVASRQGDQIGPIFTSLLIVYFGQIFENYKTSKTNFGAAFYNGKSYTKIWTKKALGHFFTNASGRPASRSTPFLSARGIDLVKLGQLFLSRARFLINKNNTWCGAERGALATRMQLSFVRTTFVITKSTFLHG
jgi:hypothetical protein